MNHKNQKRKNVKKNKKTDKAKYRTCMHAQFVGQMSVSTDPGCPNAELCMGYFICSKTSCSRCRCWSPKQKRIEEKGA